jgi:hypothetical protein
LLPFVHRGDLTKVGNVGGVSSSSIRSSRIRGHRSGEAKGSDNLIECDGVYVDIRCLECGDIRRHHRYIYNWLPI